MKNRKNYSVYELNDGQLYLKRTYSNHIYSADSVFCGAVKLFRHDTVKRIEDIELRYPSGEVLRQNYAGGVYSLSNSISVSNGIVKLISAPNHVRIDSAINRRNSREVSESMDSIIKLYSERTKIRKSFSVEFIIDIDEKGNSKVRYLFVNRGKEKNWRAILNKIEKNIVWATMQRDFLPLKESIKFVVSKKRSDRNYTILSTFLWNG